VDLAEFEALVADALDGVPEEFARYLQNVSVVIEEEPSAALLRDMGMDPDEDALYGLYQGTPLSERPHDFVALPDRISIYRGPLMRDFRSRTAIRRQIRLTIVHEIAHFFGLDERRIRRLGY
jgi:predicted Zn-dependent protease with MMP-like domain